MQMSRARQTTVGCWLALSVPDRVRVSDHKTGMMSSIMDLSARVLDAVDRMRRRKTRRRAAEDLRRSLALILDLGDLEASVASRIKEFFDPDLIVILQLDPATSEFQPSFCSGIQREELETVTITARGKLAQWFRINEACLVVHRDRGVVDYLESQEKELLDRLSAGLCAPLLARNELVGLLALGSRRTWRPSRNDAEWLSEFANQASLAFQNAALYREQRQRLDRLHRADRLAAVGQLAASVAHEVRNPLTAIRSTMQYLAGSLEDQAKRQLAAELIDEVDRINQTVSSLLSLTRTDNFQPEEVELLSLVKQTVRLFQPQAREQTVAVEEDFGEPAFHIRADPAQLKQVFLNLLLNALQSMPDGGRISVAVQRESKGTGQPQTADDSRVRIDIGDQGHGIAHDKLQAIFDPFFTTKSDGTGLGLPICHGIVRMHNGEIRVDSREGKGTTVSIHLPLQTVVKDRPIQSRGENHG